MSFQEIGAVRSIPRKVDILDSKQDSSQAVAAGIFQINTSVSSFKRLINSLGTSKDSPQLRDKIHKTRQHVGKLAKETAAKLKAASDTDYRSPEVNQSKKVGDAKLAKDFEAVLKEFQKAQQLAAERETAYAPSISQDIVSNSSIAANDYITNPENGQEHTVLLAKQQRQDDFQLENEIVFNEAVVEERDQGIKEIEHQIVEVNDIFKDLGVMVHDQGLVIDDIDSNIESSHSSTAQTNRQLLKASKTQKSNNSLSCLLIVIFAVALLIVIIVLAAR